jgi:hypothetical protein
MSCVVNFICRYTFGITQESSGHTEQAQPNHQVRSALLVRQGPPGAAGPAPCHVSSPGDHHFTNTPYMDGKCRGYVGLIQRSRGEALGSMGPPLHATNHHFEEILCTPYHWQRIPWLGVGTTGSRDTVTPTKQWIRQNRPRILTHNRPRSKHQDHPRRKSAHHRCGRT